jgi:hypothetical protein
MRTAYLPVPLHRRLLDQFAINRLVPSEQSQRSRCGLEGFYDGKDITIRFHGDLDSDNVAEIETSLSGLLAFGARRLVIDLAQVSHLHDDVIRLFAQYRGDAGILVLRSPPHDSYSRLVVLDCVAIIEH